MRVHEDSSTEPTHKFSVGVACQKRSIINMNYDVIIIGAGVIGLSQAAALAPLGLRIAVVDQQLPPQVNEDGVEDIRVYAISRFTEQKLTQWQIWPRIAQDCLCAYRDMQLCVESSTPNLSFQASDIGEPDLGHIVEENAWRIAALETLSEFPHCDFYWEHRLVAIEGSDTLTIKIAKSVETSDTDFQELTTQLLIAADGRNSRVRTLMKIALSEFPAHQTATVFHIETQLPHQNKAWQFFNAQGIVAFLPLSNPHHFSIVWTMTDQKRKERVWQAGDWQKGLSEITHHAFGSVKIISPQLSFPLIQQQAKNYVHHKVILIGDAAHGIHPLAGQGANLGIADVDVLTQKINLALRQKKSLWYERLLNAYNRERRSAAWQMMCAMDMIANSLTYPDWLRAVTSVGAKNLNRLPWIKKYLSQFALYDFCK